MTHDLTAYETYPPEYEYAYVLAHHIGEMILQGWEPVPHVEHVYVQNAGYNSPSVYVFLRKEKV